MDLRLRSIRLVADSGPHPSRPRYIQKEQTFCRRVAPLISDAGVVMTKRVLITGGAGFIGSHVSDLLLESSYAVRVLDNLTPQVHGSHGGRPHYLNADAELVIGDLRDRQVVERALGRVDCVIHLASAVGVGQSMYDIVSYVQTNDVGTAVLLEALSKQPVERLVVASSM